MVPDDHLDLLSLLHYEEHGIVCKEILKSDKNGTSVFSIYRGEGLYCDPSPESVLMIGLEGKAEVNYDDRKVVFGTLESVLIPENQHYNLIALENFKMLSIRGI